MGGTIRRLVEQKHEVHVAYQTSGNIAVGDEEVIRFLHFINGFNQIFNNSEDLVINEKYSEIRKFLKEKKDGDMDSRDILTIKGLIRRGEAVRLVHTITFRWTAFTSWICHSMKQAKSRRILSVRQM